ncbi:cilia- and flagella-associated protein 100-like [Chrysoperla carnea]|uniref:cilia- and flagella-associated protein 100-like n=1 Tax=Chrysoperla carnea TaxID=189513 RepID=UPI001D06397C|nr:cilia- and flagella-associated protein 100-like [Chrysoperla carnea]
MSTASSLKVETSRHSDPRNYYTLKKKSIIKTTAGRTPIKRTHILQKIFHTRNVPRSQYYSSQASNVTAENQRDVTKDKIPFKYPDDRNLLYYKGQLKAKKAENRIKEKYLPISAQQSNRTRQCSDILKRTFVEEPEDVVHTITDIDPEWFTMVEGRPILTQHSQSRYVQDLRNCLLTKLQISLKEDEISRQEENYQQELQTIDAMNKSFGAYVNDFEDMLSKDHAEAMKLLHELDVMLKHTAKKDEEYKNLSKDLGILRVRLYILEENWRTLKMYQKFLYQTSPMHWRREHDYIHKTEHGLVTHWSSLFGKYRLADTSVEPTLESLIDIFLEDIKTQEEPKLYFTDPEQIIVVFRELEAQNLNSLLHSEDLATPLETMTIQLEETKNTLDKELELMQEVVDDIEKNILWYEERSQQLETEARKIIYTTFKSLVAEDEIIKLFCNVEDLYETIIASNDSNIGMGPMMEAIENRYEDFMLELDTISLEAVKSAETEAYSEEYRAMTLAKDAARKVQLIDVLSHKLQRVLEPPKYRTTKELKARSPLPERRKKRKSADNKEIDPKDLEYLKLFTDFCLNTDNPQDYGVSYMK